MNLQLELFRSLQRRNLKKKNKNRGNIFMHCYLKKKKKERKKKRYVKKIEI